MRNRTKSGLLIIASLLMVQCVSMAYEGTPAFASGNDNDKMIVLPDYSTFDGPIILLAAHKNDVQKVGELLKSKVDVNTLDKNDNTVLMYAIYATRKPGESNMDLVRLILSQSGLKINAQNKSGVTALMYAVKAKDFESVKALVDAGANLSIEDMYGKTALMEAKATLEYYQKLENDYLRWMSIPQNRQEDILAGVKQLEKIIEYLEQTQKTQPVTPVESVQHKS